MNSDKILSGLIKPRLNSLTVTSGVGHHLLNTVPHGKHGGHTGRLLRDKDRLKPKYTDILSENYTFQSLFSLFDYCSLIRNHLIVINSKQISENE